MPNEEHLPPFLSAMPEASTRRATGTASFSRSISASGIRAMSGSFKKLSSDSDLK
jgi:hypothetical protein